MGFQISTVVGGAKIVATRYQCPPSGSLLSERPCRLYCGTNTLPAISTLHPMLHLSTGKQPYIFCISTNARTMFKWGYWQQAPLSKRPSVLKISPSWYVTLASVERRFESGKYLQGVDRPVEVNCTGGRLTAYSFACQSLWHFQIKGQAITRQYWIWTRSMTSWLH